MIGLNAAGTAPLDPGVGNGVIVLGGNATIGGLSPNDRNVITGGFYELTISGVGSVQSSE